MTSDLSVWIDENRSKIANRLSVDQSALSVNDLVEVFADSEPNRTKDNLPWMLQRYVGGEFTVQQVGLVANLLHRFNAARQHLPRAGRDVHRYVTIKALKRAVVYAETIGGGAVALGNTDRKSERDKAYDQSIRGRVVPSGNTVHKSERDTAYDQSIVLHKSDSWLAVIPKTAKAARWFAEGTKWPIGRKTVFQQLNDKGPLLIMQFDDGRKLLLRVTKHGNTLFDERNQHVPMHLVAWRWRQLEPLMQWAQDITPEHFRVVAPRGRGERQAVGAMQENGLGLRSVPDLLREREVILGAVRQRPMTLHLLFTECRTAELRAAFDAWRADREGAHPPAILLDTLRACITAATLRCEAVDRMPSFLRDPTLCGFARPEGPGVDQAIRLITSIPATSPEAAPWVDDVSTAISPNDSYSRQLEIVSRNGYDLRFVPKSLRSPELCMAAVQSRGLALGYVPEEIRSEEMCRAAVRSDPLALRHCRFVDEAMCMDSVIRDGKSLVGVPKRLLTKAICVTAGFDNFVALKDVPDTRWARNLYQAAVEHYPGYVVSLREAVLAKLDLPEYVRAFAQLSRHDREVKTLVKVEERDPFVWTEHATFMGGLEMLASLLREDVPMPASAAPGR